MTDTGIPTYDDVLPEGEEAAPAGVRTMAIVRWALIALMAAIAAASVLHYAGVLRPHGVETSAVQYYCPMHPAIVQDQPGSCPICGMTLVPRTRAAQAATDRGATAASNVTESGGAAGGDRTTDSAAATGAAPEAAGGAPQNAAAATSVPGLAPITLPPERVQLMGIRTATVERTALGGVLRTVGYVAADESALAQVHTRFAGWIQELRVAKTGERVRRGDVLATIYSAALLTTQQELLNARRWAGGDVGRSGGGVDTGGAMNAPRADAMSAAAGAMGAAAPPRTSLVDGARRRLELFGVAPEDVRAIERTGTPLQAVPLRSPADGYVIEKNAVQGGYVEPETTLFQIADLSTVWVLAEVYESELARVAPGAAAMLTMTAYPGATFSGRVDYVYPTLDPSTRTVRVRLVFANPDLRLKPGMYGDVVLDMPATDGLVVPREAVVDTGEMAYVFVTHPGGRFEPRRVHLGAAARDRVVVTDGLSEGDTVVTSANFLVDSESRLHAAISGMSAGATASTCDGDFDRARFPEKYDACRACEIQHRGMGTMEDDCKRAIPQPWR
jgi:Cu(I)/Ag(I) efflux system membrane fusion protein